MRRFSPINLLTLGDSWSNSFGSYTCFAQFVTPNITVTNVAIGGKCMVDPTGVTGVNTMVATIAADLVTGANADIVTICTGGQNDMVRLSRNQNALTLADMQAAVATMIDAIFAAGKRAAMLGIAINSAIRTEPNAATATATTLAYNLWLGQYSSQRGFGFVDPTLFTDSGGLKTQFNLDSAHLNPEGTNVLSTMGGGFNAIINSSIKKRTA